jgi:hypothetical protein
MIFFFFDKYFIIYLPFRYVTLANSFLINQTTFKENNIQSMVIKTSLHYMFNNEPFCVAP